MAGVVTVWLLPLTRRVALLRAWGRRGRVSGGGGRLFGPFSGVSLWALTFAAGRESPGGESLFLVRTRKTNEKEIAPTVCDPTLTLRATCGAQVRRGPAELAALKQLLALIRRTFRSSAQQRGESGYRIPDASLRLLPSRLAAHRLGYCSLSRTRERAGVRAALKIGHVSPPPVYPSHRLLPSAATAVLDPALPPLAAPRSAGFGGSGLASVSTAGEFSQTPPNPSTAGSPARQRRGADSGGDFFFVSFSCSHKKK